MGTRLGKLDDGQYDAIILAAAGIKRLGMEQRIAQFIPHDELLPAIGQGAIGIECRSDDEVVQALIMPLNDDDTQYCVETERALSRRLYGGCQLPIAGQATLNAQQLTLTGLVARVDGTEVVKSSLTGDINDGDRIGTELAEKLLADGADQILKEILG